MSPWKNALCLLAIFVAYGLAGHLDYQDAIAMEEAMRDYPPAPCPAPLDATGADGPPSSDEGAPAEPARLAEAPPPLACGPLKP